MKNIKLVVIGLSSGGVDVLQKLFTNLKKDLSVAILIVHHLPHDFHLDLPLAYGRFAKNELVVAYDKMPIELGKIYFAPPSYHLLFEKDFSLALSVDEPVHFSRPSIDVLFESAAALGKQCCGILMTGSNSDGALGLKKIHQAGGISIVQNPEEAQFPYMPEAALKIFRPRYVMNLDQIIDLLNHVGVRNASTTEDKNSDC